MNKARLKLALGRIKFKAYELYKNRQLPYKLVEAIDSLSPDDKDLEKKIAFLDELSRHYLRLKNYYKRYPEAEAQANKDIEALLNKEVCK